MKTQNTSKNRLSLVPFAIAGSILFSAYVSRAEEFQVYSVYSPIDLGQGSEAVRKDYYINMGSSSGLKKGMSLEVVRKLPTYDVANEKLYKDVSFSIAVIKVIHVESQVSIARLEKLLPLDQTPVSSPQAVMVGDRVRISQEH